MQGGNGHKPLRAVRGLLSLGRAKSAPRGPFSGALVIGVLREQGWTPEQTASDEWTVWRHVDSDARVPVNPAWRGDLGRR